MGKHVPVTLFGVTALIAGGLSTSFPETLDKKLPDTLNQAKMDIDSWTFAYAPRGWEWIILKTEHQRLIFIATIF